MSLIVSYFMNIEVALIEFPVDIKQNYIHPFAINANSEILTITVYLNSREPLHLKILVDQSEVNLPVEEYEHILPSFDPFEFLNLYIVGVTTEHFLNPSIRGIVHLECHS